MLLSSHKGIGVLERVNDLSVIVVDKAREVVRKVPSSSFGDVVNLGIDVCMGIVRNILLLVHPFFW